MLCFKEIFRCLRVVAELGVYVAEPRLAAPALPRRLRTKQSSSACFAYLFAALWRSILFVAFSVSSVSSALMSYEITLIGLLRLPLRRSLAKYPVCFSFSVSSFSPQIP